MRTPSHTAALTLCAALLSAAGCARPAAPAQSLASAAPAEPAIEGSSGSSAPRAPRAPRTTLTRSLVEETVAEGLGAFLSRVSVTPVVDGRRFVGFRLESAEDLDTWRAAGADLRVGDVIQRINGQSIERPEQALWAFEQLRIAQGVEVLGVRGSEPFRVYRPIVDAH